MQRGARLNASRLDRLDALCAALLAAAGVVLAMRIFAAADGIPIIEDEHVYLLQAKMLAAGHLSYPSPPLPEFFEAAHILVVPRYAAKYLPGHAALLAPFVALSLPWLGPTLLFGLAAALSYAAVRLAGLSRAAAIGAGVLLLVNTDLLTTFASYNSQSTSIAAVTAGIALAVAALRSPTPARMAGLVALAIFAGWVRPFAGVALLVVAAAVFVRARASLDRRSWIAAAVVLAAGALITAATCRAMTGSWTTPPWAQYAREYMPFDGPGIGAVARIRPERRLPNHLIGLFEGFLRTRLAHTWPHLPAAFVERLRVVAALAPSDAALVFIAVALFWAPLWPASVFGGVFFLAALTFHVGRAAYYIEMAPSLILLSVAGAEMAVRAAVRLRSRPVAIASLCLLSLPALWTAARLGTDFSELMSRISERRSPYRFFEPVFNTLRAERAIVFIHYPDDWDMNYDLTYNDPDILHEPLVRALDLGVRNKELLRQFPDRPAYVFNPATMKVEKIR
ncbi:MAG: hypothetical protein LC689_09180 [Myxococcales bacterium]|nr:hypothetical protein [Myxococcales bacterium]